MQQGPQLQHGWRVALLRRAPVPGQGLQRRGSLELLFSEMVVAVVVMVVVVVVVFLHISGGSGIWCEMSSSGMPSQYAPGPRPRPRLFYIKLKSEEIHKRRTPVMISSFYPLRSSLHFGRSPLRLRGVGCAGIGHSSRGRGHQKVGFANFQEATELGNTPSTLLATHHGLSWSTCSSRLGMTKGF